MLKNENRKKVTLLFGLSLILIAALFLLSIARTNAYNRTLHQELWEGSALFGDEEPEERSFSVKAVPRGSTWSKVFDIYNEGLGDFDYNYQAFTYDFTFSNETRDEVASFSFKLVFKKDVYLSSGWNGALEIHQFHDGEETVCTVPDLREFTADGCELETFTVDGETLITMHAGDYFVYTPSSSMNAREIPIEPEEATTPGFILYVAIGEDIDDSSLELHYTFHRLLRSEPFFGFACVCLFLWIIALIIFAITTAQIRKYTERHERDNKIINESIETFTGFIDAKDPYTHGHSKRVATYTRLIAKEMGFEGEDLDRIYYIALLHDCGKIGVPDNILCKPGKLTDEEFQIIKSHTVRGGEILSHFKSLENVSEGALYHHERYDGRGYPEGLAGHDIPLIARMICVADSYDAMNTNRVYRNKLSTERIISEIESNKGRQFDPEIADVMLGLLRAGKIPGEEL